MRKSRILVSVIVVSLLSILLDLKLPAAAAGEKIDWQQHWQKLGEYNPSKMFPSFRLFIDNPDAGVAFLAKKMKPISLPDRNVLDKLITDLDDPDYAVRAKAQVALREYGTSVENALREALENPESNEMRLRLIELLRKLRPSRNAKQRRIWRGLEILETIGNEKARELLKETASVAKSTWRAKEAKSCLQRLSQFDGKKCSGRATLRTVLKGHTGNVYSLAFSPDGKHLVSGGADDMVWLWDVKQGKLIKTLGRQSNVYSICFHPDGDKVYAGGSSGSLYVWSVKQRKVLQMLRGHTSTVRGVDVSPDGKMLASCSYDDTIRIWDAKNHKTLQVLRGHRGNIYTVAFGPRGKKLASGSSDDKVAVWNVRKGTKQSSFNGHTTNVYSIAFSNDGKSIVSSDSSGGVNLCETLTGKQKAQWNRNSSHRYFALHPDGRTAVFFGRNTAPLRDLLTGELLNTIKGHSQTIRCAAFSDDGRLLATGGYDETIRIWELELE